MIFSCLSIGILTFFLPADVALSVKENSVGIYPAGRRRCKQLVGIADDFLRHIINCSAGFADEMIVGFGPVIEMLRTIAAGETGNFSKFGQKLQVPVNGSQADIWKFLTDGKIKHIGRRMIRALHQAGFNRFPLAAVL